MSVDSLINRSRRGGALAAVGSFALACCVLLAASVDAWPQAAAPDKPHLVTTIVYLGKDYDEPPPLSLVDKVVTDNGVQGARIALEENNRTGRLIGQDYKLLEAMVQKDGDVAAKAKELLAAGHSLIVADLEAADLLAVADLPEAKSAIILNIRTSDDELRQEQCRRQRVSHPPRTGPCAPTRSRSISSGRNGAAGC